METPARNEWLAELLSSQRNLITEYWIEDIRSEGILGYQAITDEQLRKELPPTVDSMIYAFQTGDTEKPRQHSVGVIQRRLQDGLLLPDLQMSLHALQTAVMRIVENANVDTTKALEALASSSYMYYQVALIAAAVYEQLRVEQQRSFSMAYEFGTTLSRILDLDELLDIAVHKVAEYINVESVVVLLARPEDSQDEIRASYNLDSDIVNDIADICESLSQGIDATCAPGMSETTYIASDIRASEHLSRWAGLLASHERLSLVCAPLQAKQKRLGSMVVLWAETHTTSSTEMDFLLALANHTANAVQNAILYEEAQGKRELGVLLDASRLFSSSLDTQDILSNMAKMATKAVGADLAVVFVLDCPPQRSCRVAHYSSKRKAKGAIQKVIDVLISDEDAAGINILGHDFADGKAVLFGTTEEIPERLRSLAGTIESGMIVPLIQKDVLLGAFALMSFDKNAFTESDLSIATGLADLAAVAIENARLYEYERNIAETLQRSFLPSSLPIIERYEIAAYYRPAMAEAEVGGDFYDVFTTNNGRMGIIIGDVSGKGLKAAVSTAMGKYMIRAYVAEDASPSNVLARFNRAFYQNTAEYSFMTAFYGILDPVDNVFTYASAGHDPPLLYSSESGQIVQIRASGLCLGISDEAEYEKKKVQLQPGDALLLYTDGATDVKDDSNRLQVEGLQQLLLDNAHRSAEEIVRSVTDGIWNFSHGRLTDDIALVVLKRQ